jgi:hypothetical protein
MAVRPVLALLPPQARLRCPLHPVRHFLERLVTFLNVLTVVSNAYSVANVFATLTLIATMYPIYRWLKDRAAALLPHSVIVI